jgi:hypothetical protein
MRIDTPLLVVGRGPAALVVAKLAAGRGVPCLLAGHEVLADDTPSALDDAAVNALARHGVLDVLRPYLTATSPVTIAPRDFEEVIKHHCVADLNVTVYDEVTVVERDLGDDGGHAVLTDGTSRWELHADRFIDADLLPSQPLSAAIVAGAAAIERLTDTGH